MTSTTSRHLPKLLTSMLLAGFLAPGCESPDAADLTPEVNSSALTGENMSGTNLGGTNLGGTNLGGTNLGGTNLGGANLGGTNLGGTNLGGTNLGGANLGGTNLGGNNLGGTNLGGTNLGGANLGGTNLGGTNLGGTNLGGTNLGGSNLGGTNLAGNSLAGATLAATNLAGPATGRNIHGLAGANGILYSGEDLWTPKTAQCVVLGIGSTAFSKLLGQQSPDARISVALGKLPWGFASTRGGALTLRAWEAIVWGDKTYCSFVVAAPTTATWPGVAGFIKAVFRWNAPPSQSMDVSGIEASAVYDSTVQTSVYSYTGMMGTGAKQQAGIITDKSFVAGELAFITATTNNVSVMVDFASWVLDAQSHGLVLGNVQASPVPTYAESVYYALDNGDGTVQIGIGPGSNKVTGLGTGTSVTDSNNDLETAWVSYSLGWRSRPVPRRCAGVLFLNWRKNAGISTTGKCDSGLTWNTNTYTVPTGGTQWNVVPTTSAPMNSYMKMDDPSPTSTTVMQRKDTAGVARTVLSETYIHMWERNYD
jgi:hypothetical protein